MHSLNDVAENRLLSRWAALLPRAPGQLGRIHESDAEIVPLGDGRALALTVDTIAEEISAGLYRSPETAGRIAVVASLSDLAAVGADPLGLLLAVGLPRGATEIQEAVARGVAEACGAHGTFVLGGDTSETSALSIGCTAAGLVPVDSLTSRVGMRSGDVLFASGRVGAGAVLAARVLAGIDAASAEVAFAPRARLRAGVALRGIASACMDTSDGLVATLDQLARLNRVALEVTCPLADLLVPEAGPLATALGLPLLAFPAVLHGEYELVFSVPEARLPLLFQRASTLGWEPLRLGSVTEGQAVRIGGRTLDGAHLRNLGASLAGEPRRYAEALSAACAG